MQYHLRTKRWASPSPKKCRVRCICTHHKAATSASKIPQLSPRERKLFQESIPLPFLKYLRTCNSSQGYPTGRGKCSRVIPLPALQPPFPEASEWSSNWNLTSEGNRISPVKHEGTIFGSNEGTIFGSNGTGKKEATCKELEIIIYRAENVLPHTYTHLPLSAVLVLSKNCTITLLMLI